jgi:hypothetical protein
MILKNNYICSTIFDYLLVSAYKSKLNTKSFIKDFKYVCNIIKKEEKFVKDNNITITNTFKRDCGEYDLDIEYELIKTCLDNNHDYSMITQLNLVNYAGN